MWTYDKTFLFSSHKNIKISIQQLLPTQALRIFFCYKFIIQRTTKKNNLGGDYMIPVCRDEISARPAGTEFSLLLHVEIKFRPGKAGQFSTWS